IYSDANINDIPTYTKTTVKNNKTNDLVYVVKKGDSLFSVAQRYNTTVAKIKSLNNLKSNNIQAGQKLFIN
ncbi:MAG TPA: LysM peptidoglycan-binding domain-containing protein, partial [Ignavibacteriaceae bacterium]|nr:LysM peptidoglycan-binding domain-containing protein [Ignavibacteriaceae bacterium]